MLPTITWTSRDGVRKTADLIQDPPTIPEDKAGVIRVNHLQGPNLEDPGSALASRGVRTIVFFLFCQFVQTWESYDGGATAASIDTIQKEMGASGNAWTQAEIGLLGAMDKIGMTCTSFMWGYCLQRCNAKLLSALALLLFAVWTAIFGALRSKGLMLLAKFILGAAQSLQGVWATVWTVNMAPPDRKTMWIGLGGVSAGAGNGIGTAVAGFGTANGLSYGFAFYLQAGFLGFLWILLMCTPARLLRLQVPADRKEIANSTADKSTEVDKNKTVATSCKGAAHGLFKQVKLVLTNRIYLMTTLSDCVAQFVMSGIQFLWIRVFTEVWNLNKNYATLLFLLVTGIGAGVGIAFGPAYIDRTGGYATAPSLVRALKSLEAFAWVGALGSVVGAICLYGKVRSYDVNYLGSAGDLWMWFLFVGIFAQAASLNASVPAICGINCEVIEESMRPVATGLELTFRNVLGFTCGPLLPGVVMQIMEVSLHWNAASDPSENASELCSGLGVMMLICPVQVLLLMYARRVAQRELVVKQTQAIEDMKQALFAEDFAHLKNAVARARAAEVQQREDGVVVLSMANEVIGSYQHLGEAAMANGLEAISKDNPVILRRRILELEKELQELKAHNSELLSRLSMRAAADTDSLLDETEIRRRADLVAL